MFKQATLVAALSAALIAPAPVANAATVLTLEGGLVGMQHLLRFTPLQLRGDLCRSPNSCQGVAYFAFPAQPFTDRGAANVEKAVDALPADEPVVLFGHSQGAQVIYSDLRRWAANPGSAPDPAQVSWVSIGNPENRYGGKRPNTDEAANPWLPADTAYHGTEVIRQYDGWADWPDDSTNLIAVANALVGMFTTHTAYWNGDLNDPRNVRYTPDLPGGGPGNVTYVWVPNDTLPLVAWAGPFAPMLDNALRPLVEKGYSRPVDIPDPTPPAAVSTRRPAPSTRAAATRATAAAKPAAARSASARKRSPAKAAQSGSHADHRR